MAVRIPAERAPNAGVGRVEFDEIQHLISSLFPRQDRIAVKRSMSSDQREASLACSERRSMAAFTPIGRLAKCPSPSLMNRTST
jgi:hypothetical protein